MFIVKLNKREGSFDRVSYSYADLLTNNISLTFEEAE
ncbi:Veg family protein [Coprococcus eutactus]